MERRSLRWVFVLALGLIGSARADWTGWRGPDGLGVSRERDLPEKWSRTEGLRWSMTLPGRGASSPVVASGRVWATAQTPDTALHVLALDAKDGAVVWDTVVAQGKVRANQLHNMATPTPATDGSRVWALFGTGDLACLDSAGKVVWHRNLATEYGAYNANHGYGSSPILLEGRLYVAWMHQGASYLLAVDAASGSNVWKKERNLGAVEEAQDSYSSPMIVRPPGRVDLVVAGAEALTGQDPATGEVIWSLGGLKVPHPYGRTISGPAAGDGQVVVVASGFQNRGFTTAVPLGAKGSIPESGRTWTLPKFSPDCPTPVVYDGRVYLIRDDGNASCVDARTGEVRWQERLFSNDVKVSPVAGDGKVYFMSGQAGCVVVKAGDRLEVLARNDLAESTLSTPVLVSGRVFIRTDKALYCFGR